MEEKEEIKEDAEKCGWRNGDEKKRYEEKEEAAKKTESLLKMESRCLCFFCQHYSRVLVIKFGLGLL